MRVVPQIASIKVESSWGRGRRALVRCAVRLTRALTAGEAESLRRSLPLREAEAKRVLFYCQPQDVDDWQERLNRALGRAPPSLLPRAAGCAAPERPGRSFAGPRRLPPA